MGSIDIQKYNSQRSPVRMGFSVSEGSLSDPEKPELTIPIPESLSRRSEVEIQQRDLPFKVVESDRNIEIPDKILHLIATGDPGDLDVYIEYPANTQDGRSASRNVIVSTLEDDPYEWVLNGVGFSLIGFDDYAESVFYPPDPSKGINDYLGFMGTTYILPKGSIKPVPNTQILGAFSARRAREKYRNNSSVYKKAAKDFEVPIPVCWGEFDGFKGSFMIYKRPKNLVSFHQLALANHSIYTESQGYDPFWIEQAGYQLLKTVRDIHDGGQGLAHWQLHLGNFSIAVGVDGKARIYIGDWETATSLQSYRDKIVKAGRQANKKSGHVTHCGQIKIKDLLGGDDFTLSPKRFAMAMDATKAIVRSAGALHSVYTDAGMPLYLAQLASYVATAVDGYIPGYELVSSKKERIDARGQMLYLQLQRGSELEVSAEEILEDIVLTELAHHLRPR